MVIPPLSTIHLPGHPYVYGKKVLYKFEGFIHKGIIWDISFRGDEAKEI